MDKKLIALLAIGALIAMSLGAGFAYWYTATDNERAHAPVRGDRCRR